ncbi:MAG TPA: hypothetical protein VKP68_18580 [Ramlibacter sp.]|nr:hypothetical protein [Ramlibacter sp.]
MGLLLATAAADAQENTPGVFLVFCGVTALGRMAAGGQQRYFQRLRPYASDKRWRVREAVATGLQYVGDASMPLLLEHMQEWVQGNWYEKRAAAAALAEPRLLREAGMARRVLGVLDAITLDITSSALLHDEAFKVLRQAMGYCWSVAVAALPEAGKPMMEKWLRSSEPDVQWIMRENLKKNRLTVMDADWVARWKRT